MLHDLDAAGHELAEYMSGLSEEAYCASWMDGLEHELWDAVISGPRAYGRLQLTDDHIAKLRQLSDAAGGWIVFDDEREETLLPMAAWQARFSEWKQTAR